MDRANSISSWANSDSEERYAEYTARGLNLYKPGDIEYKYNSDGYRCDEFTGLSEIPIIFLGCSYTEGNGLCQREPWSYLLLEKIRNKTNKIIPYWNLGISGSGIDTQASMLHWVVATRLIRPKFIFGLFPTIYRREYKFNDDTRRGWVPKFIPPVDKRPQQYEVLSRTFSDEYYAQHQNERSMMIIDSICRLSDSKMIYSSWQDSNEWGLYKNIFPLLNSFQSLDLYKFKDYARDGIHPGPSYHRTLAELYWSHVEQYF